jgi:hypothetical protein
MGEVTRAESAEPGYHFGEHSVGGTRALRVQHLVLSVLLSIRYPCMSASRPYSLLSILLSFKVRAEVCVLCGWCMMFWDQSVLIC